MAVRLLPAIEPFWALNSSTRLVAGAAAAMPTSFSSGAYSAASSPLNNAAWPPCECPHTMKRLVACALLRLRAARTESSTECASLMPTR